MQTLTFSFPDIRTSRTSATAFHEFCALRARVFVENLGWSLSVKGGLEVDQYDNPNTTYILVLEAGRVVAGARIIPSDRTWRGWTNLLRDSHEGKISTIPPGLFPAGFAWAGTYECSRLVLDSTALDAESAALAFDHLGAAFETAAQTHGFDTYLSLSPPALKRKFRQMGFHVGTTGAPYECPCDGRFYRVLRLDNAAALQKVA